MSASKFLIIKTENISQIFCKTFIRWIYPARTLILNYGNTTLNVFVTELLETKNLSCENTLVFIAFRDYGLLEILQNTEVFKHKTLLNKSITVCFGDPKYFSFEGYSCKSPLLVQFFTISISWRSWSNWPTECSMPRRGKSKYFQDITGHYILLSCPRNILQTTSTGENIFCKAQTFSI